MRLKSFTISQLIDYIGKDLFYIKGKQAYFTNSDQKISRAQLLQLAQMKKCNEDLKYAKQHYNELDDEDKAWVDEELAFEKELENE